MVVQELLQQSQVLQLQEQVVVGVVFMVVVLVVLVVLGVEGELLTMQSEIMQL